MTGKELAMRIAKMNTAELFAYVMRFPELLTNSEHRVLGDAIRARYKDITL